MTTTTLLDTLATDGGFTYDPATDAVLQVGQATGWAIAVPGTERVVGTTGITREAFAAAFADIVTGYGDQLADGAVVGGWYSEDRGQYIVELTEIHKVDKATAVALGIARGQEGIFDLATGEYVETGGHGDAS